MSRLWKDPQRRSKKWSHQDHVPINEFPEHRTNVTNMRKGVVKYFNSLQLLPRAQTHNIRAYLAVLESYYYDNNSVNISFCRAVLPHTTIGQHTKVPDVIKLCTISFRRAACSIRINGSSQCTEARDASKLFRFYDSYMQSVTQLHILEVKNVLDLQRTFSPETKTRF